MTTTTLSGTTLSGTTVSGTTLPGVTLPGAEPTSPSSASSATTAPSASHRGVTVATTFKAEWTKLRTLRSTWITMGAAVVVSVGLGVLLSFATVGQLDQMTAKQRLQFDPTSLSLLGVLFATVIFGSLAVRSVTAEYTTGMIRTTFAALPHRRTVIIAKGAILAVIAFPVALASNVAAFTISQQIFASKHIEATFSQPGVVRAIVFGALAVSLVTVAGLGFGAIIKRTAGATTALSLIIIGGGIFGSAVPAAVRQYLPSSALQSMVSVTRAGQSGLLSPTMALVALAGFSVATFAVASALVGRRDA